MPALILAVAGSLVYALAGAVIGSMNAGWFDLERDANALFPVMGIGAGLVVAAFRGSVLDNQLRERHGIGRAARYFVLIGPVLYVVSWIIQFAIFGTLALGIGLVLLAIAAWRGQLMAPIDRVLIALSAVGSLVWNTETTSAFLLVAVGLVWIVLSLRLLGARGSARGRI